MIGFYSFNNSIYANYRVQRDNKSISLKYFPGIKDEGWNKATRRFKDNDLNNRIVNIEKAIIDVINSNDPLKLNSKTFSALINERLTGPEKKQTSFFEYCDIYYRYESDKLSQRRAKSILTAINKIKEYEPLLSFEAINRKFYRDFTAWLRESEYSKNYVGSIIKDLKRILNYATENEVNFKIDYQSFKKPAEEVFNIYLNEKEIESIYRLNIDDYAIMSLESNKGKIQSSYDIKRQITALDRARKLFVIGCWTGLRVENYLEIDPDIQIDLNSGYLHAIANKNGPKLRIPLHQFVREIATSGGFPATISQQKLNKHIKELGEMAGIKENIIFCRTIGNKRIEYVKPKYKMIQTHTARRSFASNLLIHGIPMQFIMAVTGHETESSFKKYVAAVQKDILTSKLSDYKIWGNND